MLNTSPWKALGLGHRNPKRIIDLRSLDDIATARMAGCSSNRLDGAPFVTFNTNRSELLTIKLLFATGSNGLFSLEKRGCE